MNTKYQICRYKNCELKGVEQPLSSFSINKNNKNGLDYRCKKCVSTISKENYHLNKEERNKANSENYKLNREKRLKQNRIWYELNKEECKRKQRVYDRKRYKNNITFKLSTCISSAVYQSLKGTKKRKSWQKLVGYTVEQLKSHLESLFKPGMSWDNYGLKGWHIDHIKPLSWFAFTSYEDPEFKEAWSLSNLQPLWAKDNLEKSNRYVG
jgi:hypothetical protein